MYTQETEVLEVEAGHDACVDGVDFEQEGDSDEDLGGRDEGGNVGDRTLASYSQRDDPRTFCTEHGTAEDDHGCVQFSG